MLSEGEVRAKYSKKDPFNYLWHTHQREIEKLEARIAELEEDNRELRCSLASIVSHDLHMPKVPLRAILIANRNPKGGSNVRS